MIILVIIVAGLLRTIIAVVVVVVASLRKEGHLYRYRLFHLFYLFTSGGFFGLQLFRFAFSLSFLCLLLILFRRFIIFTFLYFLIIY